jgi:hypothetical protein
MNMWRVGEDRRSKEMDGCPLTMCVSFERPSGCNELTGLSIPNANHLACVFPPSLPSLCLPSTSTPNVLTHSSYRNREQNGAQTLYILY